ncbi:MAG: helix-turn-helix domain-containing protein, partial [Bacteroidota bacterium]
TSSTSSKQEQAIEYLTRKQVAALLGISLPTLHKWTKQGTIQAYRLGANIRYKQADVHAALENIRYLKYHH